MQSGDDEVLARWAATTRSARVPRARRRAADAVPARERDHRRDRRLPDRGPSAPSSARWTAVDAAGISRVHTFSYSPRPGTVAAALGDRVAREEKKRRSRRAARPLRGPLAPASRGKLGRSERVLVDKVAETQCSGYTADYTRCYLPAGAAARGELVDVSCEELHADGIALPGAARRSGLS